MRRTIAIGLVLLLVASTAVFASGAQEQEEEVVRFWYHFDDPETALNPLIEKFESENPGIRIEAERVPWDAYYQRLLTAAAAGDPPDVAQVKLWWQPQLVEMGALLPLDDYIADWDGKDDVYPRVWELTRHSDGQQYYMPLQMVVLYMYYRVDHFDELGLSIPETREEFLEVAQALTRDTDGDGETDVYGFGIRGARGGHDWWGSFVLSSGAEFFDDNGNVALATPEAIAANEWFLDLYREHGVSPPTTPSDGFREIVANMQNGTTAMTIHHIGSAADMHAALGEKISAFPVPEGTDGRWTSFGDEENAVFAETDNPDAAFKWAAFLAEAENNAIWQKSSGQVSINISNEDQDHGELERFYAATSASTPFAGVLPAHPGTAEFVESVWPAATQRAFLGEISSRKMMETFAEHFSE
ncbi:MAG: sugar ABC transporter substrate-binding protein [Spirochaeta sp.]|jgi:multiple sugar transport system substrate-binding protein|nr:sugar ABC transporter substrate-binding protein [Spirochaeta sp.]